MSNTKKRRKVSKIMSLMIGAMVLALAGFIFQDFGEFLLISIICTAGIGLLVWVPVAILIGYVLLRLAFAGMYQEEVELEMKHPTEEDALHKYVREVSQPPYNYNREEVRVTLQQAGWVDADIDKALSDVFAPQGADVKEYPLS